MADSRAFGRSPASVSNPRSVRRRWSPRLAGFLAIVSTAALLSGCGSTDQADDPSGGETTTSTAAASTCVGAAAIKRDRDQFIPRELARRVPAPPPGSTLCRVDPRTRGTVYAIHQGPGGREILEYYGPALRANGCKTDEIGAPSSAYLVAGKLGLQFHCPEGSGTVVTGDAGDSYLIAWDT